MSGSTVTNNVAICPKCRTEMIHVAITLHPVIRTMQRNTFLCNTCKQTRTYMLPRTPDEHVQEGGVANRSA